MFKVSRKELDAVELYGFSDKRLGLRSIPSINKDDMTIGNSNKFRKSEPLILS